MKRQRDADEILISSDSEEQEDSVEDSDATDDDSEEEEENDDCVEDDAATTTDDDDDEDSDYDDDDNDDTYDDEEEQDDDDDDKDDDYHDNVGLQRAPKHLPSFKARKTGFSGCSRDRAVESIKEGKKKHKQRWKKGVGYASSETVSSREDQKFFAEALNIIRGGDLEELKLEHCKAYLRHYSLRLTGSRKILHDRVQEHVELKACGGMAKYPRSAFTINCTGDACTGDVILFKQKVKNYQKPHSQEAHRSSKQPFLGRRIVAGRIVKESYGSDKQQHTFTVEVLWSRGPKALPLLYPLLIKGRNLYRLKTFRQRWQDEQERKRVLKEKHSRGDVARKAREDRVSGKSSNQMRRSKGKAKVTLKREQSVNLLQVNMNANGTTGKAWSNNTDKETAFSEGSLDSSVVLSRRHSTRYESRFCGASGNMKCILSIKACFTGLLIGLQGRNIGAIARASGARVQIMENPSNPTLRLVEISGVPEQVQVARGMIAQSFLEKGLPPPVVATQSSGFTSQGWQPQNSYNAFAVPNYNPFLPHDAKRRHLW